MFNKFDIKAKNVIQKLTKNFGLFEYIVLFVYAASIIVISLHHEFSLDENQSFLIARDLNFFEMLSQLKYEGHSFLWYLMLFPIAKMGFSIEVQKIIPIIFSIATAFLILRKAPFGKVVKILILFSPGMLYYYSCFSRPYCLIIFLLSAIACLYKNKHEHPYLYSFLLGILANTHLIMVPVSVILEILFLCDKKVLKNIKKSKAESKKITISLLIFIALILVEVVVVLLGYYYCSIVLHYGSNLILANMKELLLNTWMKMIQIFFGIADSYRFYNLILAIVLILATIGSLLNQKHGIIFISQFLFMYVVHSLFWFLIPTRAYLPIYIIMFCLWISLGSDDQDKWNIKISNNLLLISLISFIIITIPNNYICIKEDYDKLFSTGKVTSLYIKKNIPKNSVFVYPYLDYQQSVAANLDSKDYKFYLSLTGKYATFSGWNIDYGYTVDEKYISKLAKKIKQLKKEYNSVYLLTTKAINSDAYTVAQLGSYYDIDLVYDSGKEDTMDNSLAWDIVYFNIYKVNNEKKLKKTY